MNEPMSRRTALTHSAGFAGGLGLLASTGLAAAQEHAGHATGPVGKALAASVKPNGEYALPPLPYAYDALEPSIDAETMTLHHDKHHAAYVKGANDALAKLAEIREGKLDPGALSDWTEKLTFNLSGHYLHAIFWAGMGGKGGQPQGVLASDVDAQFGSADRLKAQFAAAATQVQGNGWGVLAFEPLSRRLLVLQARNHQLNVAWNAIPVLVLDVWEHAYYLKYRNVRADYVKAFWNVVNWQAVGEWYGYLKTQHGAGARPDHAH
ncbi:MAG: superoxide dismutase [Isosphaeraceae bacterium]